MGDKQSKEDEEMAAIRREDEDDEEDGYFSGYAHFSIHHDMLAVNQLAISNFLRTRANSLLTWFRD